jgi:hypothetical protein
MLGTVYSPLIYTKLHRIPQARRAFFYMLLAAENANTDSPPRFSVERFAG